MTNFSSEKLGFRSRFSKLVRKLRHRSIKPKKASEEGLQSDQNAAVILPTSSPNDRMPSVTLTAARAGGTLALWGSRLPQETISGNTSILQARPDITVDNIIDNTIDDTINDTVDSLRLDPSSDLWSAAYREAVINLSKQRKDLAKLINASIGELFEKLTAKDESTSQESLFRSGMEYLQSIRAPLEQFKLALDVVSPMGSIDPTATASTVFGVVRGITVIAISFATASEEFAKQIQEMLELIAWIDECDTLGQRLEQDSIHTALVSVYQKLLEFYEAAHKILELPGSKYARAIVREEYNLQNIIKDFLNSAHTLQRYIEKATTEIVQDIKDMLMENQIDTLLDKSKLDSQEKLHGGFQQSRNDKACELFLHHEPAYTNWYHSPDSQQMVVFGPMGRGKTFTMSYLIDEIIRNNRHQIPRPKICYYYCKEEDNSQTTDILSVLILSLLKQLKGLMRIFYAWYEEDKSSGVTNPAKSPVKLKEYLRRLVKNLERPLFIVIDGLDECNERSTIIKLVDTLSQENTRVKVMISSRPYPHIVDQLKSISRIDMNVDVERDAAIVEHTIETYIGDVPEKVKNLIMVELSKHARGSAIWIRMTIELIRQKNISAVTPMEAFLQDMLLPNQLSELFKRVISRTTSEDSENKEIAVSALMIVIAALRPLSIEELAWSVALVTARNRVTSIVDLENSIDERRILSLISPFINTTDYVDKKKRQIRVVHKSVTEFIKREWGQMLPRRNHYDLQEFMIDICVDYLLLDEISTIRLFSGNELVNSPRAHNPDIKRYDPCERGFGGFFVYASCNWFDHIPAPIDKDAALEAIKPNLLTKIERLAQVGSTRLNNWRNQSLRSRCEIDINIAARIPFFSELHVYDPLCISAKLGPSPFLLGRMLDHADLSNKEFYASDAVLNSVKFIQSDTRMNSLINHPKTQDAIHRVEFFEQLIECWNIAYELMDPNVVSEDFLNLLGECLETFIKERRIHKLFSKACRRGCSPILNYLLEQACQNDALLVELKPLYADELFKAVKAVDQKCRSVRMLINFEKIFQGLAHSVNDRGENLWHVAAKTGNVVSVEILWPVLKDIAHATDYEGNTPLIQAIRAAEEYPRPYRKLIGEYLRCLSEEGYTITQREGPKPLLEAVQLGRTELCKVLISDMGKIDPLSAFIDDLDGQPVLKVEPAKNREDIIRLLLGPQPKWYSRTPP